MQTSMSDAYGRQREPEPPRSTFNVSCSHKTTWNVSNIIPIYWDYLYPGEVRRGNTKAFIRLSNPLEFPLMDNAYLTIHVFSVPLRILWDNFRKFWGERENPGDSIDYTIPVLSGTINMTTWGVSQRLLDFLGVPHLTSVDPADISALPCRAYAQIYDYWYRDNSIQDQITGTSTGDGPDNYLVYGLKQRGKRWDYFTNVLPQPQRGDAVTIGGEINSDLAAGGNPSVYSTVTGGYQQLDANATYVDVSTTTSVQANALYPGTTINELRNAVAIQRFLETDNRAGQLFGDIIEAHYSANFQDAKYAPSYIAGGRAPFVFNAIPNTAQSTGNEIGQLGSIGTGAFEGAGFTYRATEPEILMIMACVDADLTYHQGLDRKFSYRTRYDFMWPEFAGIGDQAMLTKEIYYQNNASDDNVFGYSPRYEECRTGINRISGEFRPDYATSLDTWHLAQDFTSTPTLSSAYIISAPPFDRVMVNSTPDNIIADFYFEQYSTKPLSASGVPGLARL